MHEKARLVTPFPEIGKYAGDLVFITEVEAYFSSSATANTALKFECADTRCAVPVSARIIERVKLGRKKSPSSSFRASDRNRPHVCDRLPACGEPTDSFRDGMKPGHSVRGDIPHRWVDPRKLLVPQATTVVSNHNVEENSHSARLSDLNRTGIGQSVSSSQLVRRFAIGWLNMSVQERKQEDLIAKWNLGGKYFTAFHPLWFQNSIEPQCEKIYIGNVKQTTSYKSGIAIDLQEHSRTGCQLRIWIPNQYVESGINSILHLRGMVFILGCFSEPVDRGGVSTLSLEIEHPDFLWFQESL